MNFKGKRFIKISDSCGKLDSAVISDEKDVKDLMKAWKKKGLF